MTADCISGAKGVRESCRYQAASMVLSFPSFFQPLRAARLISPFSLHHVCCIFAGTPTGWILRAKARHVDFGVRVGGRLSIWPGFLLLINIELAFPNELYSGRMNACMIRGAAYMCEQGPGWARQLGKSSQMGVTRHEGSPNPRRRLWFLSRCRQTEHKPNFIRSPLALLHTGQTGEDFRLLVRRGCLFRCRD